MRVIRRRAVAAMLAWALLMPGVASAETVTDLRDQLETLKDRARTAGRAYDSAAWDLDETDVRIAATNVRIKETRADLADARRRLGAQAEAIYRRDRLEVLAFVVGATSFEDLVTRFDYLRRVGTAQAEVVDQAVRLDGRLRAQRADLLRQRKSRAAEVRRLASKRDVLQARLAETESEFRAVKARLDAARSGGSVPSGVAAVPGPNGMVFPVVGSYYYSDTWGASRSGGRRRHQGTDIMASRGTPIVAILSGTVRSKTNSLGGKTIWLNADNGWEFYYAHLDTWVVRSGRVRAGQVIATVGSTGNAAASSPHLHLQIHPGGGGPVNPYPYLRAME